MPLARMLVNCILHHFKFCAKNPTLLLNLQQNEALQDNKNGLKVEFIMQSSIYGCVSTCSLHHCMALITIGSIYMQLEIRFMRIIDLNTCLILKSSNLQWHFYICYETIKQTRWKKTQYVSICTVAVGSSKKKKKENKKIICLMVCARSLCIYM